VQKTQQNTANVRNMVNTASVFSTVPTHDA